MDTAVANLIQVPIFGGLVVILGMVIYRLYGELRAAKAEVGAAQLARVEDAKAYSAQLLKMQEQYVTSMNAASTALAAVKEGLAETRVTVRDFGDELRRPATTRR